MPRFTFVTGASAIVRYSCLADSLPEAIDAYGKGNVFRDSEDFDNEVILAIEDEDGHQLFEGEAADELVNGPPNHEI